MATPKVRFPTQLDIDNHEKAEKAKEAKQTPSINQFINDAIRAYEPEKEQKKGQ